MESKIIGLYGCYCHPFTSWKECEMYQRQRFKIGDIVRHRCSAKSGSISELEEKGFVIVKFGELPREHVLEHVQNLIFISRNEYQLRLFN